MRLVILESPYAAQTPLYEGSHWEWATDPRQCRDGCPKCENEMRRKAERERNDRYVRVAIRDCVRRGESPFASHVLFTGALNDSLPEEREMGIRAGLAWGRVAEATVVYEDLGVSRGMQLGIDDAIRSGRSVERRKIEGWK